MNEGIQFGITSLTSYFQIIGPEGLAFTCLGVIREVKGVMNKIDSVVFPNMMIFIVLVGANG